MAEPAYLRVPFLGNTPRRLFACALLALPSAAVGQVQAVAPAAGGPGGNAPVTQSLAAMQDGSVNGQVCDDAGLLIPGSVVSLLAADHTTVLTTTADQEGHFQFLSVKPEHYTVTVSAPGFQTTEMPAVVLQVGTRLELGDVRLQPAGSRSDVTVSLSRHDLANLDLHEAEQQRVLGFPDFYTSFAWNAAPLDTGQKFSLALRATTDRMSFVGTALVASGEQIKNTFPSYGGGWTGYSKRYGAAYADAFTGKLIGSALLPSIFRQDPRYFYRGTGSRRARALHALASAVVARGDNGRLEPNYSHILGNAAAGAMSTLYHPVTNSAGQLALDNALLGTLGEAGVNLAREFLLKPFLRGAPVVAAGPGN